MINSIIHPNFIEFNQTSFRLYLSASGNDEMWQRIHIENKIKDVKQVAFLHNVLNDAIAEINGIFTIQVSISSISAKSN